MVFVALLLIFFYLLYVIKPVFDGASVEPVTEVSLPASSDKTLMVGSDEQNELLYRVGDQGVVDFFRVKGDQQHQQVKLPVPDSSKVVSSAVSAPSQQLFALGLDNGQLLLAGVEFGVSYPNNQRLITPKVKYPLGSRH